MIYYYGSQLSPNQVETAEGFLICKNVPIARTGEQMYFRHEIGLDGDPDAEVRVNRHPDDVFEVATMASFEGKPVTDDHPADSVSPENFGQLAKGHVQNVRRDGDYIVADLHINDADLIRDIRSGVKREVSCGYLCNYEADGDDYKQTHIRGNHVAVVLKGRAGHEVAIKDSAAVAEKGRHNIMAKMLSDIFRAFGMAAKDAEPEQIEELAKTTAEAVEKAQEAEPVKTQEAEPAEPEAEKVEEPAPEEKPETKDENVNTKLDAILDALQKLLAAKDAEPVEEEKTPEEQLDELIEEEEKPDDPEAAVTVPADEVGDACGKDAAAAFLREMRPIVAGMGNKAEQRRVTDALIKAFGKKGNVKTIMDAAAETAKKNAESSAKSNYELICERQRDAYDSRNPHRK